jgi:hypothetical protein
MTDNKRSLLRVFLALALMIGLAARVAPLLDPDGRGLRQFATEDGYLMLTIARNIALGNGMTVATGAIPTNGTQPLTSFLYAGLFWLVGGDKVGGVILVQIAGVIIALLCAVLLFLVGRRFLAGRPEATLVASVSAALWFAGPLATRHTQNCLETGLYTCLLLVMALVLLRFFPADGRIWSLPRCLGLGAFLGVAFWTRNDACLVAGAICLVRIAPALRQGWRSLGRPVLETAVIGTSALAVACPWLIYNRVNFGYFQPISGVAEGAHGRYGGSLVHLPANLADYFLVAFPTPSWLETHPAAVLFALLVIAGGVVFAFRLSAQLGAPARQLAAVVGVCTAAFTVFYGVFFGAEYFMSRYLFPLSPFLAVVGVHAAWTLATRVSAPRVRLVGAGASLVVGGLVVVVLVCLQQARIYARGTNNGHFQVVGWVEKHVPEETWVAAVQTGTLGYFHDRTLNLDGKVNPYALEAVLRGEMARYLLESEAEYFADWAGHWVWNGFELVVEDPERNLTVYRRCAANRRETFGG